MCFVSGFELEGHAQRLAIGLGDRFRKFKQGEMRLARIRKDGPASTVIGVNRTVHAVPVLAEVGESPCQFQTACLAPPTQPSPSVGGGQGRGQLGLYRRLMEYAVVDAQTWTMYWQH